MNIEKTNFRIIAISHNSWGSEISFNKAVKNCRQNIVWKEIDPNLKKVNMSVYIVHDETTIDPATGGLFFPANQKPILIDTIETFRPTIGRNN